MSLNSIKYKPTGTERLSENKSLSCDLFSRGLYISLIYSPQMKNNFKIIKYGTSAQCKSLLVNSTLFPIILASK